MKKLLLSFLSFLGIASSVSAEPSTAYAVGQVWAYKTRPQEQASQLIIAKIEDYSPNEKVYHIYVNGLELKNPHIQGGVQHVLGHSPVSKTTLDASVTKLVEVTTKIPDVSEGYAEWRKAKEASGAGIFTIPVAQIVQYLEDVVTGKVATKKTSG